MEKDEENETMESIQKMLEEETTLVDLVSARETESRGFAAALERAKRHREDATARRDELKTIMDKKGDVYVQGAISMGFLTREAAEEKLEDVAKRRREDSSSAESLPPALAAYAKEVGTVDRATMEVESADVRVQKAKRDLDESTSRIREARADLEALCRRLETAQHKVLAPYFARAEKNDQAVDRYRIQALCRQIGGIPSSMRRKVWPVLLGVESRGSRDADARLRAEMRSTPGDLKTQRIIEADVARTRQKIPYFRQERVKGTMNRMLTFYCKRRGEEYTQGLHELCAPFVWLYRSSSEDEEDDEATAFNVFYAFVTNFLPTMFSGEDFNLLNASLRFFELLLQYHDPRLSNLLQQYGLRSQLYATSWFVTLFAHTLPLTHIFDVWDMYIIEGSPFVHHFASLALLQSTSHTLMAAEAETDGRVQISRDLLMEQLMINKDHFHSEGFGNVRQLTCRARALLSTTPKSFYQMLRQVCYRLDGTLPDASLVARLEAMICLEVKPRELLQVEKRLQSSDNAVESSSPRARQPTRLGDRIKYFVFDCRSQEDYDKAHFALSFHLDPKLLTGDAATDFDEALKRFEPLRGSAGFCFMDSGAVEGGGRFFTLAQGLRSVQQKPMLSVATRFALFFIQRGYDRVALVPGGFAACREALRNSPKLRDLLFGAEISTSPSSSSLTVSSLTGRKDSSSVFSMVSRMISAGLEDETLGEDHGDVKAPTPTLESVPSGDESKKRNANVILVSFDGVKDVDAFGVEFREIRLAMTDPAEWKAAEWQRGALNRAIPAAGDEGIKCMYLLGSHDDEYLARDSFYQVRVCVHRNSPTPKTPVHGWSEWSNASKPFGWSTQKDESEKHNGPDAEHVKDRHLNGVVRPMYPILPDEFIVSFRERRSFGMVLRGVPSPGQRGERYARRVFVIKIEPRSLAEDTKIEAMDEIIALDDMPIGIPPFNNLDDVIEYIKDFSGGRTTSDDVDQGSITFRFRRQPVPSSVVSPSPKKGITRKKANSGTKMMGRWLKKQFSGRLKAKSSTSDTSTCSREDDSIANFLQLNSSSSVSTDPASLGLMSLPSRDSEPSFKAERKIGKVFESCRLCIFEGHVLALKPSETFEGWGKLVVKFPLTSLLKITSRKSLANSVIFQVKDYTPPGDFVGVLPKTAEILFLVEEKKDFIAKVQEQFNS